MATPTKKVAVTIVSLVLLIALGFGVWWVVSNANAIKEGLDGTKLYTQEEYDANYGQGVLDGAVIKTEQEAMIANLKAQVDTLNATQTSLKKEIAEKNAEIAELKEQNTQNTSDKTALQNEIESLNGLVATMQKDIDYYISKIQ